MKVHSCSVQGRKLTGFECRINVNSRKQFKGSSARHPTRSFMRVEYIETVGDQPLPQSLVISSREVDQPVIDGLSPDPKRKKPKHCNRQPISSIGDGERQLRPSRLSTLKQHQMEVKEIKQAQRRSLAAYRRQKALKQLKELIELGNRQHNILVDLYSEGVRKRNDPKQLSPRSSPSERLSWGANEKKLKEYAANTLKQISIGMNGLKARSYSTNRLTQSQQKFQRSSKKKRYVSPAATKPATCENLDELLKEEFRRVEEKVFLEKVVKIQKAFRRWRNRRTLVDLLHILYGRRPARQLLMQTVETAVMTDPLVLPQPTIIMPRAPEGLESMRLKEAKLMQEKCQLLVQTREAMQLQINFIMDSDEGIATNLHIINENLSCLVEHLVKNYQEHIRHRVLIPYGSSVIQRLRAMSGWDMSEYDPSVVDEEILQEFEQAALDAVDYTAPQFRCYQKIHNKVLFDAFNEALNHRQSYFTIMGEPFPWSISPRVLRVMPEDVDLRQLLTQCKDEVVNHARMLAGLHIEDGPRNLTPFGRVGMQSQLSHPLHSDPFIGHTLSTKVDQEVTPWLAQRESEMFWFENERTEVVIGLAECVMDVFLQEAAHAIYRIQLKRRLQLV